jgi:hypothetical protein
MKEAEDAGHSWRTVKRAKDRLKVKAKREGFGKEGSWIWRLPSEGDNDRSKDAIGGQREPYFDGQESVASYGQEGHATHSGNGKWPDGNADPDIVEGVI